MEALETIDDDCDRQGIILVKLDNPQEAAQYGIEQIPSLVYFEESIPHIYEGNLENENEVLGWLIHQMKHEEIEQVTDEMIDLLILEHKFVAVLFYDRLDRMSSKILGELENIDDDAEDKDIVMVKIDIDHDDLGILERFNVPNSLPKLALFEDDQPVQIFEGDLGIEEDALKWLVQATIEEIPVAMNLKKPEPAPAAKPAPAKEAPAAPPKEKPAPKKEKPKEDLTASRKAIKDPKPKLEEPLEDDEELVKFNFFSYKLVIQKLIFNLFYRVKPLKPSEL